MPGGREAKEAKEAKDVKEVKETKARIGPVKNYTDLLVYKQAYQLTLRVSTFRERCLEKSSSSWGASFAGHRALRLLTL